MVQLHLRNQEKDFSSHSTCLGAVRKAVAISLTKERKAVANARVDIDSLQVYLTQCIDQMVSESQLPHKIVNLLFTIINQNIKLTILWER